MALPAGITTATVTFGSTVDFQGNPVTTKLKVQPSATVFWSGTHAPMVAFAINVESDTEGSVVLPHTDQAGFLDLNGQPVTNWTYKVTGSWTSSGGTRTFAKEFNLPSSVSVIDFDTIGGGTISGGN
jgi:hypothetical protein